MKITNETQTMEIVDHLKELCAGHDWYFQMADDSRAYHAGLAVADKINFVKNVLIARGYEQADDVISKYRPKMPTFETMLKPMPKSLPPIVDGRHDWKNYEFNWDLNEWVKK